MFRLLILILILISIYFIFTTINNNSNEFSSSINLDNNKYINNIKLKKESKKRLEKESKKRLEKELDKKLEKKLEKESEKRLEKENDKDNKLTKKEYDKIFNELLNESFTNETITKKLNEPTTHILKPIENRISYQADIDFFCPHMLETNLYYIIPYDLTENHIRKELIKMLNSEWENYSDEFILSNWQNQDIFYVLVSNIEDSQGEFIGSIAIDRKMFYPFISQLYVNKKYRSLGYSKILLDFANQHIKSMGFDEARLWCEKELIPFYEKLGWSIEKISDEKYVMIKSLISLDPMTINTSSI